MISGRPSEPRVLPLTDDEFAGRMAAFEPFERPPRLAVGVSGGADSLALALLADRWSRARGGSIVALTVDHRLRRESGAEAAQVAAWLGARAIAHRILPWTGDKPGGAVQPAARAARHALLAEHCRGHGLLHLLLAHHGDDQAETLIMRAVAESGRDGLAGISTVVETADLRILRPLLDVSRPRLEATLSQAGQTWIDDPSNRDPKYLRTIARGLAANAGEAEAVAQSFGAGRIARDAAVADCLAAAVALYPEGWAAIDVARLGAAVADIGQRALARVLMTVGGRPYPPASEALERLHAEITAPAWQAGRTLAGCRVAPWRGAALIAREFAAIDDQRHIEVAELVLWDSRFRIRLAGAEEGENVALRVLGAEGWASVAAVDKSLRTQSIPAVVRPTLPALYDLEGVREVPHLLYRRQGVDPDSVRILSAMFRPRHVLAGAGFAVSSRPQRSVGQI